MRNEIVATADDVVGSNATELLHCIKEEGHVWVLLAEPTLPIWVLLAPPQHLKSESHPEVKLHIFRQILHHLKTHITTCKTHSHCDGFGRERFAMLYVQSHVPARQLLVPLLNC